jgi:hypothetical protein
VTQQLPCAFFPQRYVICACDEEVCLPARYQRSFPDLRIRRAHAAKARPRGALLGHLRAIAAIPLLAITFGLFRLSEGTRWKRTTTWSLALLALAVASGAVISRPEMWPFLHYPAWDWNRRWFLLLPAGTFLEVLTVGALLWALLAARGRRPSPAELALAVLPAFVAFQGVHLVRFLVTDWARERWAFSSVKALFWSFDPLAWGVLALSLCRYVRRTRAPVRRASPAPGGRS